MRMASIEAQRNVISKYLILVLVVTFLAWLFDAMDLQVLTLVLFPTLHSLTGATAPAVIGRLGGALVGLKLFGWGVGGVVFGVVADRIGRKRTMIISMIIYSVFTGLSALANSWDMLALMQVLAGVGIGAEWSAGAALITETWPEQYRAQAMQIMQTAFAVGYFCAAAFDLWLGGSGWRWVFVGVAVPGLLTAGITALIHEPERWQRLRRDPELQKTVAGTQPLRRIFAPDLRRVTIVGTVVALAMMVGSWGGTTWIPSWIHELLGPVNATRSSTIVSYATMLESGGAVVGYITLIWLTRAIGRRWSYFAFCLGALLSSLYLFTQIHTYQSVLVMMPFYGYFVIGGFGTFAAYLPELFPTIVRATGQGFAWNFARLITGIGPFIGGTLIATLGSYPAASATISMVFVIGLFAIWFGPETRGKALRDV